MSVRSDRLTGWKITVQKTIPRAAHVVFALLSDIEQMAGLGPEHSKARWLNEARGAGAQFQGVNRIGALRWEVICTVTDFEPPHRFGWTVGDTAQPSSTWSYGLEAASGVAVEATTVTQTFEHGPGDSFVRRAIEYAPVAANVIIARRGLQLTRNMSAVLDQVDARLTGRAKSPHSQRSN